MAVSVKTQLRREQDKVKKLIKLEYLGLDKDIANTTLANNLLEPQNRNEIENPHLHLLRIIRRPENFFFTCKHILNIELAPFQVVALRELWIRKYPMFIAGRGAGKSFLLAIYSLLRALISQGCKIIVVGAAFRQAKVIFEYCEAVWRNAPILRDLVGMNGRNGPRRDIDRCTFIIGESQIMALPLGNGDKIRGQRANVIIADEFSKISKNIYEEVVSGFGSTSKDPIEAMKIAARRRVYQREGINVKQNSAFSIQTGNQSIIAGTADYTFGHFYSYWKQYKGIIESGGDNKKLAEALNGKTPPKFHWQNYSIIRLAAELLPQGYMDDEHVARSLITTDKASYAIEYGATFVGDSQGFYPRSLIEGSTVRPETLPLMLPKVELFHALLTGSREKQYVFAVDTASESDNFAISILEINENHRRIIYCWTTTRLKHLERIKNGIVKEKNFYAYCARKIRDLMKVFNCVRIEMDSQGGGRAVAEALHDMDKLEKGELPIYEIIDEDNAGLHILELVEFSDAKWVSEANHGLKKDLQDKVLLFPYFDPIVLEQANQEDKSLGRVVINDNREIHLQDTLEDVVIEIEELKDELITIQHTQTPGTNRDKWDTPPVSTLGGSRKGRLRKDRYTSLLMANMAARQIMRAPEPITYGVVGGIAKDVLSLSNSHIDDVDLLEAPDWFLSSSEPSEYTGGIALDPNNLDELGII